MLRFTIRRAVLLMAVVGSIYCSAAAGESANPSGSIEALPDALVLLAPPDEVAPVVVDAAFEFHDINEINEIEETFEFTGVLTLSWKDPRQAFLPAPGAEEKVYQGSYQFNEVSTGWYPQLVLANESGDYQKSGVTLRITPDGTSTLVETIQAVAEIELDMSLFPF